MAFRLCPECRVHYIKDDEEMCSSCKIKIKNKENLKTQNTGVGIFSDSQSNSKRFNVNYDGYRAYLIKRGYAVNTFKGTKSTVYSYEIALMKIAEIENMSFGDMFRDVNKLVTEYGLNGCKSELGQNGHGTWRNALNRLKDFKDYVKYNMK